MEKDKISVNQLLTTNLANLLTSPFDKDNPVPNRPVVLKMKEKNSQHTDDLVLFVAFITLDQCFTEPRN